MLNFWPISFVAFGTSSQEDFFVNIVYLYSQDYSTMANIKTVKVVVKHVPDYSASREKNDLGFLTFDLQGPMTY